MYATLESNPLYLRVFMHDTVNTGNYGVTVLHLMPDPVWSGHGSTTHAYSQVDPRV